MPLHQNLKKKNHSSIFHSKHVIKSFHSVITGNRSVQSVLIKCRSANKPGDLIIEWLTWMLNVFWLATCQLTSANELSGEPQNLQLAVSILHIIKYYKLLFLAPFEFLVVQNS